MLFSSRNCQGLAFVVKAVPSYFIFFLFLYMLSPPVTNAFVMQSVPDTNPFPSFLSLTSGLQIIFPSHLYQQHRCNICFIFQWRQDNFFLQVQNVSHNTGKASCEISKCCHPGKRPKQGLMQGNGDLVFCKTQCSEAQMSKRTTYEMPAGVTWIFLIYIYKFYLSTYVAIYLLFFFFFISAKHWCFSCILNCGFNLSAYQMDSRDCVFQKDEKPYRNLLWDC